MQVPLVFSRFLLIKLSTNVQVPSTMLGGESHFQRQIIRGFIKFLCRRSVGFYSRAFLVFLMKESKKRRRKQPGKLTAKSRSQPVNLPGAWPLMKPQQSVIVSVSSKSDLNKYPMLKPGQNRF